MQNTVKYVIILYPSEKTVTKLNRHNISMTVSYKHAI